MWNCCLQLPFRVHLWDQIWPHNTEQELQSCVRRFLIPSCVVEAPILFCWLLCPGDKQNLPQTEYSRLNPALWCYAAEGVGKTWKIFISIFIIFMYKIHVLHWLLIFLSIGLQQSMQPFSRWTCFAKQNIGIKDICSISVMVFWHVSLSTSCVWFFFESKVKCLRSGRMEDEVDSWAITPNLMFENFSAMLLHGPAAEFSRNVFLGSLTPSEFVVAMMGNRTPMWGPSPRIQPMIWVVPNCWNEG